MQISAINKFSLIEFPWEISSIVFTPSCNFRCGYCHNSEFVLPEKLKYIYKKLIKNETSYKSKSSKLNAAFLMILRHFKN